MKLLIAIISLGFILISFQQPDPLSESIERGKEVYGVFCVTCHLSSGKGMPGIFPPLAESDYLLTKRNESIKAIKKGQKGEITVNGVKYNNIMAPLGLDDEEVADVMNFILNSWGNESKEMVTEEEVSKI